MAGLELAMALWAAEMNMKAKANVFAVSMTVLMFGVFGLLMMQLG